MKLPQKEIQLKTPKGDLTLCIEPMTLEDLPQVMVLERRCFPSPWSERLFREELEHPWAILELFRMIDGPTEFWETLRENRDLFIEKKVLKQPPPKPTMPLIAYMDYWLVQSELHLLSLAVHPDFRRLGLGRIMIERIMEATRFVAGKRVKLEVRKNNKAAQKLYTKLGFVVKKIKKGYYSDTGEDGLVMVRKVEPVERDASKSGAPKKPTLDAKKPKLK